MGLLRSFRLLWFLSLLPTVTSYAAFQQNIPNGEIVPSPCNPNYVWQGVGHQAKGGGGPRNPFGLAFIEHGYTWTEELCRADSDMDGKTNGEELGDPNCTWQKGTTPETDLGLSHPDIMPVDALLKNTSVPAEVTTYMCQVIDLPTDQDYHLVATKPNLDNINVMHHITVYGCTDEAQIESSSYNPSKCFMNRVPGCEEIIGIWTVGVPGVCYHESAGFRIGKTGIKRIMMELHWNNPMLVDTYTDGSGITLYLTPNLRPYDAGMFAIGTMELEIPPGLERYTASSTCRSKCTNKYMDGQINIVGALNHMHYLGSSAESKMITNDRTEKTLSYEETYSYDSPKFIIFDTPTVMKPGYELQLDCHFKSTSRDQVTRYGEGTEEEMCFAFIMYYPRANWTAGDCISPWSSCDGNYCDFDALGDQTNQETIERNQKLFANCEPGVCKDGCLDVVREIFQTPCFSETNYKAQKETLKADYTVEVKLGLLDYFYRLDSCNAELAKEECKRDNLPTEVDGASANMVSMLCVTGIALFISIL